MTNSFVTSIITKAQEMCISATSPNLQQIHMNIWSFRTNIVTVIIHTGNQYIPLCLDFVDFIQSLCGLNIGFLRATKVPVHALGKCDWSLISLDMEELNTFLLYDYDGLYDVVKHRPLRLRRLAE